MTTGRLKFFGLLLSGVFFALLLTFAPSGNTAQAQTCDPSGSRDGTASPNVVLPNTPVTFTAVNFSPNEEVSYWFTLPNGNTFGTASPLCCADQSGTVQFEPLTLPEAFYQFPGRWAMTVQGATSSHISVIYFCVVTSIQPTEPPATNTPVPAPPTDTPLPATATTAPATETATSTAVAATETTTPPTAQPTAVPPTVEASPTSPTALPTAVAPTPPPTAIPPTIEVLPTIEATPIIAGMPITGGSTGGRDDAALYVLAVFVALGMIALGTFAMRKATARR